LDRFGRKEEREWEKEEGFILLGRDFSDFSLKK